MKKERIEKRGSDLVAVGRFLRVFLTALILACDSVKMPADPQSSIDENSLLKISSAFSVEVQVCTWLDDKKSAYTIEFDDARPAHYLVSAPELEARGIYGTFALNTRGISNWRHWQALSQRGHEIASHTWSHPKLIELNDDQIRFELARSKYDILSKIAGLKAVPSFTFPYGTSDPRVIALIKEHYESARFGGGINASELQEDDFYHLRGYSLYPPYDVTVMNRALDHTIRSGGWFVSYFHDVTPSHAINETYLPLNIFREHLDYVVDCKDQLWIAPRGKIVRYIRLRQSATVLTKTDQGKYLEIAIHCEDERLVDTCLSLRVQLPENWVYSRNNILVLQDNKLSRLPITDHSVLIELTPEKPVRLMQQ